MRINRMNAVFGKLQNNTLSLQSGLNIIQAPNETGKSTWCAFLLSMLYGINSRERDRAGAPADKNRYAPWSGTPMAGRMDITTPHGDITLTRSTPRASAPMGGFTAVYTGTNDPVPGLSGALCGEQLLGVTREVYTRSAFIRQNSLGITQNAELERRIAALISSGEENTSYSEAADALKKQLHRRKHNRTGRIPALEAELQQLRLQAQESDTLSRQILLLRQQESTLLQQESSLRQELAQWALWETQQNALRTPEATAAAHTALLEAEALRQQLESDRIPENDTIARLRGAIVNLNTSRTALEKSRAFRDEAMKDLLSAESSVNRSPFAGQTPAQVQNFLTDTIAPLEAQDKSLLPFIIPGIALLLVALLPLDGIGPLKYLTIPAGLLAILCPLWQRRRRKRTLQTILKKHGVSAAAELYALADTYSTLLSHRDTAQAELDKRTAAADTLYNSICANEQAILLEIRRFAPLAHDLSTADALLRDCALRRKELSAAESAAREALRRQEAAMQELQAAAQTVSRPQREQSVILAELEQTVAALNTCRGTIQRFTGQLSSVGDSAQLHADIRAGEATLQNLQTEYDALQLAAEALDAANQTLQNRFAPALGQRTAQLFHHLTDGRYQKVTLDRSFHLSAEPTGDPVSRDAVLLSAGAADQLYLAARLAICESVLPAEQHAPLILDDALATFDDQRCFTALRLLKEIARNRQILLFTCHSREAEFFARDSEVAILRLTNPAEKV